MKSAINKYTKEVEDTLNRLSIKNDKEKAAKLKKYIGTNLNLLGMASKAQVDAHKKGFSFYFKYIFCKNDLVKIINCKTNCIILSFILQS